MLREVQRIVDAEDARTQYAPIKIKSSLLRLIKRALQGADISLPHQATPIKPQPAPRADAAKPEPISSSAEGDLRVDEKELRAQAQQSRVLEESEDLLDAR
ncbi:MAG: hypothetical protein WAU00_00345 [Caldilinea sp.]|uniref:hypothetical protein n=1 Tax=Caldilinea sp. TaxID=2293560 RepID=UPI002C36DC59|nr:hypothetical protein [Anaerolineales bacterium]HQY92423.1 hypothetical protein [Caldilinea sp.]HRA68615.1 hypothetical protein [Caldilinea sp.]